jgi:hypothetical protein
VNYVLVPGLLITTFREKAVFYHYLKTFCTKQDRKNIRLMESNHIQNLKMENCYWQNTSEMGDACGKKILGYYYFKQYNVAAKFHVKFCVL